MLSIETYLEKVFEVVTMKAQLSELARVELIMPPSDFVNQRRERLNTDIDLVMAELDKSVKPLEIAPWEQYIDVLWQPVK
jgi:hypothetical protein